MPIYIYECGSCLGKWKESHGMTEEGPAECFWCESTNIYRKPSNFTNLSKPLNEKKKKVGEMTNEFNENSKEDIKKQKENLDNKR